MGRARWATAVVLMFLGVGLLPVAVGIAVVERAHDADSLDRSLSREASEEAGVLGNYFETARAITSIAGSHPVYREALALPPSKRTPSRLSEVRRALASFGSLYPRGIGEAALLDANGDVVARDVPDRFKARKDLNNRTYLDLYRETMEVDAGAVYQAAPYGSVAADSRVISTSTPIVDGSKVKGILYFEISIESFRREAQRKSRGLHVVVLDARTGAQVFDAAVPQSYATGGATAGNIAPILTSRETSGILTIDGSRSAFRKLDAEDGNANEWFVVAKAPASAFSLFHAGSGPTGLAIAAILVIVLALIALRTAARALEKAAATDSLTGLGNRRCLVKELDKLIASSNGRQPLSIVLCDLDGFKNYNDTFGHPAGDALLARLAGKLDAAIGEDARAYRMGGDEFCVLTLGNGAQAETLTSIASEALSEQGDGFSIGCSTGHVIVPTEADSASEALGLADKRMYERKHSGRRSAGQQSMDVLLAALSERDPNLGLHVGGVAEWAETVGRNFGLSAEELVQVRRAAELHDIGKVAIPDSILHAPRKLTEEEWEFMRRHTIVGERILSVAPSLRHVGRLVRYSHEWWSGSGYPDALSGEEIPLGSRIIAVCDAYDAMTEDRPYRNAMTHGMAIAELRRCAGTQFDPQVVEEFCRVVQPQEIVLPDLEDTPSNR